MFGSPGLPPRVEAYPTWSLTTDQRAYLQALHEGPTAALDRFRTAFLCRESGPLKEGEEAVKMSYALSKYYEESPVDNDELWRASADTEFILFLIDIITGPDFLDHSPQFSSNICGPLMELLKTWKLDIESGRELRIMRPDLCDSFWDGIESIWTSMWDRRSSLAHRCDSDAAWRRVAIAFDLMACAIVDLRGRILPESPRVSPVMVRTVFFSWIYCHGAPSLTEHDIAGDPSFHYAPRLLYDYYNELSLDSHETTMATKSRAFTEELSKYMDPKAFIRATLNVLAYSPSLSDASLLSFLRVLVLQMKSMGLHWYTAAPLMTAFNTALGRQTPGGSGTNSQQSMELYGAVYEHLQLMVSGLVAGSISSPSFPGPKFWDILVGGLSSASQADALLQHEHGYCRCDDHPALAEGLSTFLELLSALVTSLASDIEAGSLPQDVIDDVRHAGVDPRMQATGIWYDIVVGLRRNVRHDPSWTTYTTLLEIWLKLGNTFGIDEVSQREVNAAQRARQCWWPSCVHHLKPSEKLLLVCKGCKEARYCSAACQRSDWKQGGHRTACRRVK